MYHLFLTILAIALMAALTVASVNYIPFWYKSANDAEAALRHALPKLETAYDFVAKDLGGVPAPTAAADGGLMENFGPVLRFAPSAPPGYKWTYGVHAEDASSWAGLGYFCLTPTGEGASQGVYRGMRRLRTVYSPEQLVYGTNCATATSDAVAPESFPAPVVVKFFVHSIPVYEPTFEPEDEESPPEDEDEEPEG